MIHFSKAKILSDLALMIKLLDKYDKSYKIERHRLNEVVGVCQKSDLDTLRVELRDFVINASLSGMKPNKTLNSMTVSIDLSYSLSSSMSNTIDIFSDYDFQLHITGRGKHENYYYCWHLDKEDNTNGDYSHPLYHFHAGGKTIVDDSYETGDLLYIRSPRIPHPPMDIILVIHFLIRNFINTGEESDFKQILDDDDYIDIILRAQKRVLDPYFHTFKENKHSTYTPQNLFPLYL